jgi:class 3 adenylate cyclase/tetratricopeptide (TPR) repeat protein
MSKVHEWLEAIGLAQYADAFEANDIDLDLLGQVDDQMLKDIGVSSGGHRLRIRNAIAKLSPASPLSKNEASAATKPKIRDVAERRQVTVMFSDLVGSTALSARMDPEDLREVISAYQKCLAETVQRFGGFVAKYMGDGVLVYFGYPQAHEDDAERAVRAGLELIQAVSRLKSSAPLRTRVGIATGLVVVGDLIGTGSAQEQAVVGETPNLAARLQGSAEPNTVVIAESTRKLLGNLFELEDLGASELKGIADPVRAWAALRPSSVESRFEALHASGLTELVGREEELELLLRRWSKAKAGEGQVALLSGEAGIGKSRLTAALLERLVAAPHTRLRYFCSPQRTDSALYPVIGQMERAAGFVHDDTPQAKLDKLDAVLAQTSTRMEDAALFAEMLSLPNDGRYPAFDLTPEHRRHRTLEALVSQMEALTRQNPLLMTFEDAHWTDPTSLEVLCRIVDRIRSLPVLLLVTFRPEFDPPWLGRPYVTALTINRLAERDISAMIDRVVGNKLLPANVRQDIIERTDGIPLFVEEMTKAVLEAGSEGEAQRTAAAILSPSLVVPASLQASLMARLDRLGPAKEIAQIGAAIGREFSHALLAAVVHKPEAELDATLDRLMAAGLLFRQGVPPHATYLFKHALVQDAAYGTLLREPRRGLHARIAEALEGRFPEMAESQPELLAHHCMEAGLVEKAIEYWLMAGRLATAQSAYVEAVSHLRKGLELATSSKGQESQESQEINFQLALGAALIATKGYASVEAEVAFLRAHQLLQEVKDVARMEEALHGLQMVTYNRADFNKSLNFARQELELAEQRDNPSALCAAQKNMAASFHSMGRFDAGFWHAEKAVALFRRGLPGSDVRSYAHDFGIAAMGHYALLAWHHGLFATSADAAQSALMAAEQSKQTNTGAYGRHFAGSLRAAVLADISTLKTRTNALLTFAQEHRLQQWIAWGTCYLGRVLVNEGKAAEAVDKVREGLGQCEQLSNKAFRPLFLSFLARAQAAIGKTGEALSTLEDAIAVGEATEERWYVAELLRNKGALYQTTGTNNGVAEECFRQAVSTAREQGSQCFELRATTSLARLWRDQSKCNEARDLLAPVYGWFTEGFDTLDLKEAKALLDELSS